MKGKPMEIKIEIDSNLLSKQQISDIKANIKNEIIFHKDEFKNIPAKLYINLYNNPLSNSLTGSAFNENREEVVKITYSLVPPHTCNYFFLGFTSTM